MKKRNLNLLVALVIGLAIVGGLVFANGKGLMGSINQNRAATRVEIAKYLALAISKDDDFSRFAGCFEDVAGKSYEGYVCYLVVQGAAWGVGEHLLFRPEINVARAEVASMFLRAYSSVGGVDVVVPDGAPYTDVADPDIWYYSTIATVAKLGIPDVMGWRGKDFRPNANLTLRQLGNWSRGLERALR